MKKRDYVMISKYIPAKEKKTQLNKVDIFYILICSLILTGLLQGGQKMLTKAFPKQVIAQKASIAYDPSKSTTKTIEVKNDDRAKRLQKFLESKNSPLSELAGYIIKQSDENALDWTLITSIAGKESSFGTYKPAIDHFNPFGLGGTKFLTFSSWEEAIGYEANLLGQYYRGNAIRGIQLKYCPDRECDPNWTSDVTSFGQEILSVNQ